MKHENSPSSVMYTHLKKLGLTYSDAAQILMKTQLSFAGKPLQTRIDERSQLSRRIVHVAPGDIPPALFNDFEESSESLLGTFVSCAGLFSLPHQAICSLIDHFQTDAAQDMVSALMEYHIDATLYTNMLWYISRLDLEDDAQRLKLLIMLFIIAGCIANLQTAADCVISYASEHCHATFSTEETRAAVENERQGAEQPALMLMRVVDGKLFASSSSYLLKPEGTIIGLLCTDRGAITDVGEDVSRKHVRIWREDGVWQIIGLGSTNGTTLVRGNDHAEIVVEPPKRERDAAFEPSPIAIGPSDIIHLGQSTSFIVIPATV